MIKTITIVDNEDSEGTQTVYLNNFEGNGVQVKINKAKVKFDLYQDCERFNSVAVRYNAGFTLNATCHNDSNNKLLSIYYPERDFSKVSDKVLLDELKKRNVLTEDKVYRITQY